MNLWAKNVCYRFSNIYLHCCGQLSVIMLVSLMAIRCNLNCCNDSYDGNVRDETGTVVHEGPDDTSCLYVTRGYQEISLNRKSDCIPDTSGLWRCDIADYNDEIQSMYIYISNDNSIGK